MARAKKQPMKIKRVSQTKTPAKYLIITIDIRAITRAIMAVYTMYFQVSLMSLMASDTTEADEVARLML